MKSYVLGFAFDDLGRVALVRKSRPEWQRGLWNGVGGGVEPGELPLDAMVREFEEETGAKVGAQDWAFVGTILDRDSFVFVYTSTSSTVREIRSTTDEEVELFVPWRFPGKMIPNVRAMIHLCQIPTGQRPEFTLSYR